MSWIMFGIGVMVGGMVGVVTMCLCVVSGRESRREEQREHDRC
jgi:hypothetical protein